MIVYRVEHREKRVGPFYNGCISDNHEAREMPTPYDRDQFKISEFLEHYDFVPTRYLALFAFKSLRSLYFWFDYALRHELRTKGHIIKVVQLPDNSPTDHPAYAVSPTQVVYLRTYATTLALLRLDQLPIDLPPYRV